MWSATVSPPSSLPDGKASSTMPLPRRFVLRQFALDRLHQLVDVRLFRELLRSLQLWILRFDSQVIADAAEQLEDGCHFLFREQIDLQVQVIAVIALPAHAVLRDQHERGDQDALHRDDERQQAKRVWIEPEVRRRQRVPTGPTDERDDVGRNEAEAAGKSGDAVAQPISPGLVVQRLPLEVDDRANVFRGRIRSTSWLAHRYGRCKL